MVIMGFLLTEEDRKNKGSNHVQLRREIELKCECYICGLLFAEVWPFPYPSNIYVCTVYDCVNGTLPSAFLFVAVFKVEYYCDIIIQVTLFPCSIYREDKDRDWDWYGDVMCCHLLSVHCVCCVGRIENEIPEIRRGTVIVVSLLLLRRRLSSWCESGMCGWVWWNVEPQRGRLAHMYTLTHTCTPTHTHTYTINCHLFIILLCYYACTHVSHLFHNFLLLGSLLLFKINNSLMY